MNDVKILLSCNESSEHYISALHELGAEITAQYLPKVDINYDGLILCGGCDIDPARYGEPMNGSINIDFKRDESEFALLRAFVDAGKPVLGICRGHQLINVFFGGSLYQDISESDLHKKHNDLDSVHTVTATSDSIVGKLHGENFPVNSAHHQAIKVIGEGLRATAFWNHCHVEAIEHTALPIFGVQWHPERMCFRKQRDDTVCGADVLKYFLDLCKAYRENYS